MTPLLLTAFLAHAHAAGTALPTVTLDWRRDVGLLTATAPPGEHVQAEAPVHGWIALGDRRIEVMTHGWAVVDGLAVNLSDQARVFQGQLTLSLCEDAGTTCRLVDVGFAGDVPGRKGTTQLAVQPVRHDTATQGPAHQGPTPQDAFAAAASTGQLVLLDFSAVWCPPCNLMSAEVLHDPDDSAALEGFIVTMVDADHPSSWALKDRYHVGGYPTLVAARADGTEVDRYLGYEGEAALLGWLAKVADTTPVAELPSPDQVTPAEAATVALRLARSGEDAGAWLTRAEAAANHPDTVLARFLTTPTADDAAWLVAHDAQRVLVWVWDALPLAEQDAALAASMRPVLRAALSDARGMQAADLLYASAKLTADPETQQLVFASAASTLRASLTGDAAIDRGNWTFLADLYRLSGDVDAARQVLQDGIASYPHEFTFLYAQTRLLVREDLFDAALPYAIATVAVSYGDNRLRAVHVAAEAMAGTGDSAGAVALIDRTLAETARPAEGLDVRTPRYLTALEELRAELQGPVAAE